MQSSKFFTYNLYIIIFGVRCTPSIFFKKTMYEKKCLVTLQMSCSFRSGGHLSEEQFRCWEYMLERNTQMLFDKELDTLSRGFARRSMPQRPSAIGMWPTRTKSSPHLNSTTPPTPTDSTFFSRLLLLLSLMKNIL